MVNGIMLTLFVGDTIDNLALDALLVNARSVAHVIATTAKSTSIIEEEVAGKTRRKRRRAPGGFGFGFVDLGYSCQDTDREM